MASHKPAECAKFTSRPGSTPDVRRSIGVPHPLERTPAIHRHERHGRHTTPYFPYLCGSPRDGPRREVRLAITPIVTEKSPYLCRSGSGMTLMTLQYRIGMRVNEWAITSIETCAAAVFRECQLLEAR